MSANRNVSLTPQSVNHLSNQVPVERPRGRLAEMPVRQVEAQPPKAMSWWKKALIGIGVCLAAGAAIALTGGLALGIGTAVGAGLIGAGIGIAGVGSGLSTAAAAVTTTQPSPRAEQVNVVKHAWQQMDHCASNYLKAYARGDVAGIRQAVSDEGGRLAFYRLQQSGYAGNFTEAFNQRLDMQLASMTPAQLRELQQTRQTHGLTPATVDRAIWNREFNMITPVRNTYREHFSLLDSKEDRSEKTRQEYAKKYEEYCAKANGTRQKAEEQFLTQWMGHESHAPFITALLEDKVNQALARYNPHV